LKVSIFFTALPASIATSDSGRTVAVTMSILNATISPRLEYLKRTFGEMYDLGYGS
jgi:hypothetical protein